MSEGLTLAHLKGTRKGFDGGIISHGKLHQGALQILRKGRM
jgi:hypothetical protein